MNFKALQPSVILSSAVVSFGVASVVSTATPVGAVVLGPPVTLHFGCITNNNAANCQTGQNQFVAKVSGFQDNPTSQVQVLFEFLNRAKTPMTALASSITQVYFDDTSPFSLLSLAKIYKTDGVRFSKNANPPNLPGGSQISFDADYSAGANSSDDSIVRNGVNPGEYLSILFNTRPGFTDPFNAVITDLRTGSLRIGVQAQGFSSKGKESFVNTAVPEPFTFLGSGVALGIGALLQRKSSKFKKTNS